eukprot:469721-Pelagomonas_calceolata.AAC.1
MVKVCVLLGLCFAFPSSTCSSLIQVISVKRWASAGSNRSKPLVAYNPNSNPAATTSMQPPPPPAAAAARQPSLTNGSGYAATAALSRRPQPLQVMLATSEAARASYSVFMTACALVR